MDTAQGSCEATHMSCRWPGSRRSSKLSTSVCPTWAGKSAHIAAEQHCLTRGAALVCPVVLAGCQRSDMYPVQDGLPYLLLRLPLALLHVRLQAFGIALQ